MNNSILPELFLYSVKCEFFYLKYRPKLYINLNRIDTANLFSFNTYLKE
nr:MAG TPA: hypothetical protein [Caudoviricetes sp.]